MHNGLIRVIFVFCLSRSTRGCKPHYQSLGFLYDCHEHVYDPAGVLPWTQGFDWTVRIITDVFIHFLVNSKEGEIDSTVC